MHSTRAETESSYVVNVTSSQAEPLALKVGSMCVTVHGLFHLPAKLTELNSEHDILEIIFKPTAKYYYDDQRVTVMELPEHCISASPSSIVCVNNGIRNSNSNSSNTSNNNYALEFDKHENNLFCSLDEGKKIEEINSSIDMDIEMNAMSINENSQNMHSNNSSDVTINTGSKSSNSNNKRLPPLSSKTNTSIAPHHVLQPETHIDCDNESDYNSPTLFTSSTAHSVKSSPSSKNVKSKYEELRKEVSPEQILETEGCSSSSTTNVAKNGVREIFVSDSGINNNISEEILEKQKRERHKQRQMYLKAHQFTVYFPSRADLKVIIEIFVAVRHRRRDSSAMRWLTAPIESLNFSSGLNSVNAGGSINGSGGSSATNNSNRNSDIPSFAVAHGEVMYYKSVNRLVGLSIGHLLCSMSLPHVYEDLSSSSCLFNNETEKKKKIVNATLELPHVLQTRCNSELMNAVVKRLVQNEQEHIRFRSFLPSVESTLTRLYLNEEELH